MMKLGRNQKAKREEEKRVELRNMGICIECRRLPQENGSELCGACLARAAENKWRRDEKAREDSRREACRLASRSAREVIDLLQINQRMLEQNNRLAYYCNDFRAELAESLPPTWFKDLPPKTTRLPYPTEWPWGSRYARRKVLWKDKIPEEWRAGWLRKLVYSALDRPRWPLKLQWCKGWNDPLKDVYALAIFFCLSVQSWMEKRGHEPRLRKEILETLDNLHDWLADHGNVLWLEWEQLYEEADGLESVAKEWEDTEDAFLTSPFRPDRLQDGIVEALTRGSQKGTGKGTISGPKA